MADLTHNDRDGGAQWTPDARTRQWVYDCLYCGNTFLPSPQTGPVTGAGSITGPPGMNIICPECGSTNVTGPRTRRIDDEVAIYPATSVPGVHMFTGEPLEIDNIDTV
jgi:DNA-directed RNA polymerase subunit RPC12/RpoP